MKTSLECIPCFLKQALEAARMTTDDETIHTQVLKEVMKHLQTVSLTDSPPELSREIHELIRTITRSSDPYKKVKDQSNELAEKQYPHLKELVQKADDPLLMAIKLAIVGNVIDFGTSNRYKLDDMIDHAINREFNDKAYSLFKKTLEHAHTILYIADNAGELFFDKILLEELARLHKDITFVVRAHSIINDATKADAHYAGIDKLATVIEGDAEQPRSSPGMVLSYASKEFLHHFNSADLVIAKGQGNYEGLSDVERTVFFLLVVKCPLVAQDIGDELARLILKVNQ